MDIHVDIRGFLEIHAWICYGFSDQGKQRHASLTIQIVLLIENTFSPFLRAVLL